MHIAALLYYYDIILLPNGGSGGGSPLAHRAMSGDTSRADLCVLASASPSACFEQGEDEGL